MGGPFKKAEVESKTLLPGHKKSLARSRGETRKSRQALKSYRSTNRLFKIPAKAFGLFRLVLLIDFPQTVNSLYGQTAFCQAKVFNFSEKSEFGSVKYELKILRKFFSRMSFWTRARSDFSLLKDFLGKFFLENRLTLGSGEV